MLCAPQMSAPAVSDCDIDRNRDYLYRILTIPNTIECSQLYDGIRTLISNSTRHPCSKDVLSAANQSSILQKALILLAMHHDSCIQQHIIDHRNTCGDTVSQYVYEVLPAHVDSFLTGKTSLEYFVCSSILDYVTI